MALSEKSRPATDDNIDPGDPTARRRVYLWYLSDVSFKNIWLVLKEIVKEAKLREQAGGRTPVVERTAARVGCDCLAPNAD
jgi:hypothetical protein